MLLLKWTGRRQYHIGKSGRFVEIRIYGDHKVQGGKRFLGVISIGHRQHHIACECDEGLQLTVPGRKDLVSENRHGELPTKLRALPDPRAVTVITRTCGGQ